MRYDVTFLFVCVYHTYVELNHRFKLWYWKYVGKELTPVDYVQININHKMLKRKENKGNNKITELRTILQRESQNS